MPLDIAFGIFGAIAFARIENLQITPWLIALAIFFALSPDLDFLGGIADGHSTGKFSHEHRDIFHYPLIFVPIGFVLISFSSFPAATLFAVLALFHFIHDSIGIGWGIRWLYPLSEKYYKFFATDDGGWSSNIVTAWTPAEQHETAEAHGDPQWIKHYLRSKFFLIECAAFIAAIITLLVFNK